MNIKFDGKGSVKIGMEQYLGDAVIESGLNITKSVATPALRIQTELVQIVIQVVNDLTRFLDLRQCLRFLYFFVRILIVFINLFL